MIKIGSIKIDSYPLGIYKTNGLPSTIVPVPTNLDFCPICGSSLRHGFCYAIQVNDCECIKVCGDLCLKCDAFFSTADYILMQLEQKRSDKTPYKLSTSFRGSYDKVRYDSIFTNKKSAFRQYIAMTDGRTLVITLVTNIEEENVKDHIFHYTTKLGVALLKAEQKTPKSVILKGTHYFIVKIKKRKVMDSVAYNDIESIIVEDRLSYEDLPELTSAKTLYIYRGKIGCHRNHHCFEMKASIASLDGQAKFYVEYCYECNQFLMKEDDYKKNLRRLKLFPLKVRMYNMTYSTDLRGLAEESPLMLNGYTVSQNVGLTKHQRQAMLSFFIMHNIIDKRTVLDYLEQFLNTNGRRCGNEIAVKKWLDDKQFVLDYSVTEPPTVIVGRIERRK